MLTISLPFPGFLSGHILFPPIVIDTGNCFFYWLAGNPAYSQVARPWVDRGASPSRSLTQQSITLDE